MTDQSNSDILFGRRARVTIYKQGMTSEEIQEALSSETESGKNESQDSSKTEPNKPSGNSGILSFEITEDLALEFEIYKTLDNAGKGNDASLKIYGLSQDTAEVMGYQMLTCKIEVGYKGQPLTPIFLGDILSASYKKAKRGGQSEAEFSMSQSYLKMHTGTKYSKAFPRDTLLSAVLFDASNHFGVDILFKSLAPDTASLLTKVYPYGVSVDGTLNEVLNKILPPNGFRWNINQANQVTVFQDDVYTNQDGQSGALVNGAVKLESTPENENVTSSGIKIYHLDSNSGLVDLPYLETESITKRLAEVQVDTPVKNSKTGKTRKKTIRPKIKVARQIVNFKTLLLPDLDVGDIVKIQTENAKDLNNNYGILSIKYVGKTYGTEWYCECVGVATNKLD